MAYGITSLLIYDSKTGLAAATPVKIPETERSLGGEKSPSILQFLHPYCPCSVSTVEQLHSILNDASVSTFRGSDRI